MKNLKCTLSMMALATTLSLTGCGNQHSNTELKDIQISEMTSSNKEVSEDIEQSQTIEITNSLTKVELRDLAYEIEQELDSYYYFSYYYDSGTIRIVKKLWIEDEKYEISEQLYSKLNQLLQQSSTLELKHIDDKFDLSILDVSNIEKLEINGIKIDLVKSLIQQVSSNKGILEYTMHNELDDAKNVINFFINNNIELYDLYLNFESNKDLSAVSGQLQNLNAKIISFSVNCSDETEVNENANIDIKLHDNTSYLFLKFYNHHDFNSLKELGNVRISSNNSSVYIAINNVLITENTDFFINCNEFDIALDGKHTDTLAFYDLLYAKDFCYDNEEVGTSMCYYGGLKELHIYDWLQDEFELVIHENIYLWDVIEKIEETKGVTKVKK